MKRYILTVFLICIMILSVQIFQRRQAVAQTEALLAVFGQSTIPDWKPIIRIPVAVRDLIDGQLHVYQREKAHLQADIDAVSNYPAGRLVFVLDGSSMSQADWNADANTSMAAIDAHIAKLQTY